MENCHRSWEGVIDGELGRSFSYRSLLRNGGDLIHANQSPDHELGLVGKQSAKREKEGIIHILELRTYAFIDRERYGRET
jgi:hypothetical protein